MAQAEAERPEGLGALLRRPAIASGLASGLVAYLVMFGALLALSYYFAAERLGPTLAGLQLAVLPVALGALAPLAGRVAPRLGVRVLAAGGLLLTGAGLLGLALRHDGPGLLFGLVLAGAGLGIFTPVNNAAVMGAAPRSRAGVLGGILNTIRGLGAALGVALAGLLYGAHGLTVTLLVLGALALAAAGLLLFSPASAALRASAPWGRRCGGRRRL